MTAPSRALSCGTFPARPSNTTLRPALGPTTPGTSSTGSWSWRLPDASARRHPEDPLDRLGADRDRAGGGVRLLGGSGLQGPDRGGLRGRPGELEPGDDHDRPRVRPQDLYRAPD